MGAPPAVQLAAAVVAVVPQRALPVVMVLPGVAPQVAMAAHLALLRGARQGPLGLSGLVVAAAVVGFRAAVAAPGRSGRRHQTAQLLGLVAAAEEPLVQ